MRLHQTLEVRPFVGPIAEGLALRQTAPAQPDLRASRQAVRFTFLVHNLYFAIYQQRAIVHHRHFNIRHSILRSQRV